MRSLICGLAVLWWLMAACTEVTPAQGTTPTGDEGDAAGDASVPDGAEADAPPEATPDVPSDPGPPDAIEVDAAPPDADAVVEVDAVPPDAVPDADAAVPDADAAVPDADAVAPDADAVPDADPCQPLAGCDLACELGYQTDPDGCEVCACVMCGSDADCATAISCDSASCQDGACVCACAAPVPDELAWADCGFSADAPWCDCGPTGLTCVDRPDYQCPGLCAPGEEVMFTCPDGSEIPYCSCTTNECKPECRYAGSFSEGWYDPCTDELIEYVKCAGVTNEWGYLVECPVACGAIGSKSEGWFSPCTGLITWDQCAPEWTCLDSPEGACGMAGCLAEYGFSFVCDDGTTVPFCLCEEGAWWCDPAPWSQCTGMAACVEEGEGYDGMDGWATCCPGLVDIPDIEEVTAPDGTTSCAALPCDCHVCTLCGDGACGPGENDCNCPADCPGPPPGLMGVGDPCNAAVGCGADLMCFQFDASGPSNSGVCTSICDPLVDQPGLCGAGNVCVMLPTSAAPGFCLPGCTDDADCAVQGTSCNAWVPTGPLSDAGGGCWFWEACDPLDLDSCPSVGVEPQMCSMWMGGMTECVPAGALGAGDACTQSNQCGPGLVCSSIGSCAPICTKDEACLAAGTGDLCNKNLQNLKYGWCVWFE